MSFSSQTLPTAFRRLWPRNETLAVVFPAQDTRSPRSDRVRKVTIFLTIFLAAIGVRLLLWQDNRPSFPRIFTGMVEHHKANARLLLNGDVTRFVTGPAPPEDANILTYPPGYPIIMALVFRLGGDSDTSMRIFQIICDAAAAGLLFLVAAELLPIPAAAIAGALAALSPQLAYYSLLLLPDSMATLPILLALYFIIRAQKSNSLRALVAAGALLGLSCWLRSNALLLAPFLAVLLLVIMAPGRRRLSAAVLLASAILVIAPITIRNLVVFHAFIPLSLGAGQMLNVGIGDYDRERRFGLPGTDLETVTSEAESFKRPDYAASLFGGNGIERDQVRMKRGLAVVRSHPGWFAKVVLRRALSMFRLERVNLVSMVPAPTHALETAKEMKPTWSGEATGFVALNTPAQTPAKITFVADSQTVRIESSDLRGNNRLVSPLIDVERNSDYLLRLPVRVDVGNVVITIMDADQKQTLASTPIMHTLETSADLGQPTFTVEIPFVNRETDQVRVVIGSEGPRPEPTVVQVGQIEFFRLGPASLMWTRFIRVIVHVAQKFFLSAWILPLALIGLLLLNAAGHRRWLIILLAIPLYYLSAQSFLHTEYRYVMAIQHSLFVLTAATLYWLTSTLLQLSRTRWPRLQR